MLFSVTSLSYSLMFSVLLLICVRACTCIMYVLTYVNECDVDFETNTTVITSYLNFSYLNE